MNFNIEEYLDSLPEDVEQIFVNFKGLTYLPDLTRFKNLDYLICNNNKLTSLPALPDKLRCLVCYNNHLSSLPTLPEYLEVLDCHNNRLTSLPDLPEFLNHLYCVKNRLTRLPVLPKRLRDLYCHYNYLTILPNLPDKLMYLSFEGNPIYQISSNIDNTNINYIFIIRHKIKILNNFCHLYYSLKFKNRFRKLLWENIRKTKIEQKYHPRYLIENLADENADLDTILNNW